ncbi:hypothetical protein [Phenylobacterium sp.]|jgi:hypothetical protein|uniref:hypothetical protein n=1 Tax=Phenylobacterium sp. TaxID=1871053 RepID=UPI002F3E91B4
MNAPVSLSGWRSLLDVLEINGQSFMHAVQELRRMHTYMQQSNDQEIWKVSIDMAHRQPLLAAIEGMIEATNQLYARAARISATRLRDNLENNEHYTWVQMGEALQDIDSRLRDELGLVRLFVLNDQESMYLRPGAELFGQQISDRYPSIMFDLEEAAKCLALGRATASAYHAMRALEVSIRALAAFLEIPDPTKPAERNWGTVLKAIKDAMDAKYPAKLRMPGSEGCKVEALYTTLDAIKNPWRNATMHAENVYQPHEANHILQAVNQHMMKQVDVFNEDGEGVPTAAELLG